MTAEDIEDHRLLFSTWFEKLENEDQDHGVVQPPITATSRLTGSKLTEALRKRLHRLCFCVTEKGYMGLVGGLSKIGDQTCVIEGAPVPMVLRHQGRSSETGYR